MNEILRGAISGQIEAAGKYAADVEMRRESYAGQLKRQLIETNNRSEKIQRMLAIIERNPDLEELLSLMREV